MKRLLTALLIAAALLTPSFALAQANVTSRWVSGNLVFYDKSGNIIATFDGTNREFDVPSGSTLDLNGTIDITTFQLGGTTVTATGTQINNLAGAQGGLASILSAGLGGADSILKTEAATHTLVAAHATKDRAVLAVVYVDETYAVGTGTLPTVKFGETSTIEKFMAATVLDTEAAGTTYVYAGTNTSTKAIIATSTAAVGNSTGGCTITVIAIPTT
jgi:hypothetical protein